MAVNPVAIAVRAERHKRLRRGEKIAHPSRMDSGIAPTDHSALMDANQDSQLHRNHHAVSSGPGCMSAFAGYAHGSKSSIGEPGDSVLECGGRGALENGVPSREGQIMDGTTIELTEKLERLLREAAQVSVDLDRAKGTIVGVPHYSVIEARAHELGQQLSRQIQLRRMGEISAQASSSAKCPECGTRCELGRKKRRVTSIDGPLVVEEPVGHCPVCRRGFFPPPGNLGI